MRRDIFPAAPDQAGRHYNYFRDDDPAAGKYWESDPRGIKAGINIYAHAESSPIGQDARKKRRMLRRGIVRSSWKLYEPDVNSPQLRPHKRLKPVE